MNDPKKYKLPLFVGKPTGTESDDFQDNLCEATELSICHLVWSTLYNVRCNESENIKAMAKAKTMVNGNKKHLIDEGKEKAYQKIISNHHDLQDNRAK